MKEDLEERKYFIYVHIGLKSGNIVYIGMGYSNNRHISNKRNALHSFVYKEEEGVEEKIIINFLTQIRAFEIESALIKYYGIEYDWCNLSNINPELHISNINAENLVEILELPKPKREKKTLEQFEKYNYFKELSFSNEKRYGITYNYKTKTYRCDARISKYNLNVLTNSYPSIEEVENEVELMLKHQDLLLNLDLDSKNYKTKFRELIKNLI